MENSEDTISKNSDMKDTIGGGDSEGAKAPLTMERINEFMNKVYQKHGKLMVILAVDERDGKMKNILQTNRFDDFMKSQAPLKLGI